MMDDLNIEMHRTIRELYARADAHVRRDRLPDLPWSELLAEGNIGDEQGDHAQGEHQH